MEGIIERYYVRDFLFLKESIEDWLFKFSKKNPWRISVGILRGNSQGIPGKISKGISTGLSIGVHGGISEKIKGILIIHKAYFVGISLRISKGNSRKILKKVIGG